MESSLSTLLSKTGKRDVKPHYRSDC